MNVAKPFVYKLGDAVWVKTGKLPPWPGCIVLPNSSTEKPNKRNVQLISFFGFRGVEWIKESRLCPYLKYKHWFINSRRIPLFKEAVAEIEKFIERKNEYLKYKSAGMNSVNGLQGNKSAASGSKRSSTGSVNRQPKKKKLSRKDSIKHIEKILNKLSIDTSSSTADKDGVSQGMKPENSKASKLSFGFIGVETTESGIVKNLIKFGHKVTLCNMKDQELRPRTSRETFLTPCDVVEKSDIIFCRASDPIAAKDVIYEVLCTRNSLRGKGYVEMTTIDDETSVYICELITAKGGRYLEAQLEGGEEEANEGSLIVLSGGDRTLFDDCRTCFNAIARTAFYFGKVGFAAKMNLVMQVVKGVSLAGVVEALAFADRCGLSQKDVLQVLNSTDVANPYLNKNAELLVTAKFHQLEESLEHIRKDVILALDTADSMKLPLAMSSTANEVYKQTSFVLLLKLSEFREGSQV